MTSRSPLADRCCLLLSFLCLVAVAGCGQGSDRQRQTVGGKVYLGDELVQKAKIYFEPIEPEEGPRVAGNVDLGLFYIDKEFGPMNGKFRVEIRPAGKELSEFEANIKSGDKVEAIYQEIPAIYQTHSSTLRATVELDAENWFEFKLK